METIQIKGVLEIDRERGVIYFHSNKKGHSVLRICSLPKPIPNNGELLDITHMVGCSWREVVEKPSRMVRFYGVDEWNRPVFRGARSQFYGSVDKLVEYGATEFDVKKAITEKDLVYFGSSFGCEPDGSEVLGIKIEWMV